MDIRHQNIMIYTAVFHVTILDSTSNFIKKFFNFKQQTAVFLRLTVYLVWVAT